MNHAHIYDFLQNEKRRFLCIRESAGLLIEPFPETFFSNVYLSNARARKLASIHANYVTLASNVPLTCWLSFDETLCGEVGCAVRFPCACRQIKRQAMRSFASACL
jgi:hypothetical protein